jgi:hypothetical protein
MNAGVKEEYLVSCFEMLDLDSLIMPSFHPLLVDLGAVVGLLPPFIQFNQLDLSFHPG